MTWLMFTLATPASADDTPARTEALADCPATAAELPASTYHTAADSRFQRDGVIVVLKEQRRIMLYDHGQIATIAGGGPACWRVGLGSGYPAGHKQRQGDMRTPEGWYSTSDRPWSAFYAAITVHYPEAADADRGEGAGLISASEAAAIREASANGSMPPMDGKLGGRILVHGGGSSTDWTLGCVAMDDADIEALRARLPKGMRTKILILP